MTTTSPTFRTRLRTTACLILALVLGLPLLVSGPALAVKARIPVFVSILPQAGFVREIGGSLVTVSVLVGPGHSPATYEPTPRQMAALSTARVFFCAGVPFERGLVPKVAGLPTAPVIAELHAEPYVVTGGPQRPHDHVHDRSDSLDPHTWLDPLRVMAFADTVCIHLSRLRPEAAADFAARRDQLKQRLHELDTAISRILAPYAGAEFFVFHPAYGHFARRYGLVQIAVEADGHEPGARQLAAVIDRAKAAGARVIVVQPQFSRRSAQAVADATGAEILVLDPLAKDYETNLRHIAAALASALGTDP